MVEDSRYLCRLDIRDDEYFLHTSFHDDGEEGIDIVLSDCSQAWKGSLSQQELQKLSKKVKMQLSDYLAQTKKALSQPNDCGLQFIYQLTGSGDGGRKLTWKKHVASESIKIQLGEISLEECEDLPEAVRSIFYHSIKNTKHLQSQISSLEADNQRLAAERAGALKRLDKCVSAKEELENDLFSKFVAVLNRKKAKLSELQAEVEDLSASGPSTSTMSESVRRGKKSDSDVDKPSLTDSEYDTDDDSEKKTPAKRSKLSQKVASSTADDSLILDAGDDIDLPNRGPRRRKQLSGRGVRKATPAKPVIPRVSSSDKAPKGRPSTSRTPSSAKSSLRKSTSKSDDNFDPDDLFDDLA